MAHKQDSKSLGEHLLRPQRRRRGFRWRLRSLGRHVGLAGAPRAGRGRGRGALVRLARPRAPAGRAGGGWGALAAGGLRRAGGPDVLRQEIKLPG